MAKINTLNYQPLNVWDGDDDLFIVQQVDDTKVATPNQVKSFVLGTVDEVPTQNSGNLVKSGGVFSTMAVPKYDATNRREYYEGGAAFDGNIDSSPTAGSNNAVASGGTKTYVDNEVVYEEFTDTSSFTITAGNIGTYFDTHIFDVSKTGYVPIAVTLAEWAHPGVYQIIPQINGNIIRCNIYRAISSQQSVGNNDYMIRVAYRRAN